MVVKVAARQLVSMTRTILFVHDQMQTWMETQNIESKANEL